jgi:hypothetical protein
MSGLKRVALVFGVVTLLLFADGIYLLATHNQVGGDTGVLPATRRSRRSRPAWPS